MPQVDEIRLQIRRGKVVVTATVGGRKRILWKESASKPFDERLGPIAMSFSPLAQKG